ACCARGCQTCSRRRSPSARTPAEPAHLTLRRRALLQRTRIEEVFSFPIPVMKRKSFSLTSFDCGFTLPSVVFALQEVHHEGSEIVSAVCGTARSAAKRVRKCVRSSSCADDDALLR